MPRVPLPVYPLLVAPVVAFAVFVWPRFIVYGPGPFIVGPLTVLFLILCPIATLVLAVAQAAWESREVIANAAKVRRNQVWDALHPNDVALKRSIARIESGHVTKRPGALSVVDTDQHGRLSAASLVERP